MTTTVKEIGKRILCVLIVLLFIMTFIPEIFEYGFFRWMALQLDEPIISAESQ